jgi:PAS domain S-box-containing protein
MTSLDPQDYLAFHTVSEFASVVLACLVFWIAWHGSEDRRRGGLRWLAGCLFAAAWLDGAHALSYEGMPRFITPSDTEKAIDFWLAARLLMVVGLLGATLVGDRRLARPRERAVFIGALLACDTAVLWIVLAHGAELPRTYLGNAGLTPFKRLVEWALIALLVAAGWRFAVRGWRDGSGDPARASWLLMAACAAAVAAEWCFTRYAAATDAYAVAGHLLKLVVYFMIYRAVYLATVRLPLAHLNELATARRRAANAVSVTDEQGVVRWANDACRRMTGLTLAELVGRPLATLAQPEGVAALALPALGSSWHGRLRGRRADGADYVEQCTVTPIASEFGSVVGYVCVGEDVTERSRSELALKASEERLRALFNAAPDCIVVIDRQGRIEHANPQVQALFGHGPEELRGRDVALLMPPADGARHDAFIQRYLATGEPHIIGRGREVIGRHKDGRPLQLHLTVGEMQLPDGRHFIGFIRDVSERIEQQRRHDELQRRLMQAQKMEALGQLTGGVAHDFNNILAGVLGLSKLALERYVEDPQGKLARYLQEIVKVSERGRDLVAKMLAFSRREALPPADPVDLGPQVREVVRLLGMQMPDGVALQAEVDAVVPPVRLGLTELHQLLANLVLNARDAVKGHGRVDVHLSFGRPGANGCSSCGAIVTGDWVRLTVSDDGEGMSPEQLSRIFEPFYTTKQVGQGSGLGLPMVQGVVHGCNGHIAVHSTHGQGTTMELLLPPARQGAVGPAQAGGAPQPPASRLLRVWVIDDDPVVSLYLCEVLSLQGHEVQAFDAPAGALSRFRAAPREPDVVITDHAMPGLPGDELARGMLALRPDLPVILCTGHGDGFDEARAREAGIRCVLHKPFEAQALVEALRDCEAG